MIRRCFLLLFLPAILYGQSRDSLLHALDRLPTDDTARVNTLNTLAYTCWIEGEDSLAKAYSYQSIALAKKLNFPKGESDGRFQLVRIEMDILEDVAAAYAHLDTADRTAKATRDDLMLGISSFRRAQLISMTNMETPASLDSLLDLSLSLFKETRSKYWESLVYMEKATLLGWDGNYAQAIDLMIKARTIQETLNNEKALRATLPNLGATYVQVEMYAEALECFEKAEEIARRNNDVRVLAFLHNQKGDIYKKQRNWEEALTSYTAAAEIYKRTGTNQYLPSAYARISDICFKMGRYTEALDFNLLSDSIFKASNVPGAVYHFVTANFGNIYLQQKNYPKVIRVASEGLASLQDINTLLFEQSTYHRQLSEAYRHTGNYRLAYEHLLKYKDASDSLFNDESRQKILVSTMAYEFDKMKSAKDMEIQQLENMQLLQTRNLLLFATLAGLCVLIYILWANRRLKKYNQDLLHKNREIEMALDRGQKIERRRVASELHDNLNTKLAALRWSLESLDTRQWDDSNRSLHQKLLDMANDAYKDVRLISHNMLPPELEQEGLPAAFTQLVRRLNELGDIRFRFEAKNIHRRFSKNEEHQLYNLALEAINNTLKHAEATEVGISLWVEGTMLKLEISDNGKGMALSATAGGMGIHNMTNRAESIGGKITIDSMPGKGTTLLFSMILA